MKCKFLGYSRGVKGYRLWSPEDCKLVVSRDISFNEPRLLKEGERSILSTNKGKSLEGKVQETRLLGETSLNTENFSNNEEFKSDGLDQDETADREHIEEATTSEALAQQRSGRI